VSITFASVLKAAVWTFHIYRRKTHTIIGLIGDTSKIDIELQEAIETYRVGKANQRSVQKR
jgi:hypothetical protein